MQRMLQIIMVIVIAKATLLNAESINFDTAWTFIYDGGVATKNGVVYSIKDVFYDAIVLDDGTSYCAGTTADSNNSSGTFLVKLDLNGKLLWKKILNKYGSCRSIINAENGDLIIGGERGYNPLVMRLDTAGNIKWSSWYYDSTKNKSKLLRSATVNALIETSRGTIACAAGDEYPDNSGLAFNNYSVFLELDSTGKVFNGNEFNNESGYQMGGFSISEGTKKYLLMAGNQTVIYLDSNGNDIWKKQYTMMLDGVGSVVNTVSSVKVLRDGTPMVIGQAYEGNCWTRYATLYKDAWWSPIAYAYGTNDAWDTLGRQGGDDKIYDFAQLNNGNIVFVGKKSSTGDLGGVWSFVTDSTGKNVLWEKQTNIVYRSTDGRQPRPMSVCASPDGGFTVVGDYACTDSLGGVNAFAAHYVVKPPISNLKMLINSRTDQIAQHSTQGSKIVFTTEHSSNNATNLCIFNASGKMLETVSVTGNTIEWDSTPYGKGVYFYRIVSGKDSYSGTVPVFR
jgi:hypothetical protein